MKRLIIALLLIAATHSESLAGTPSAIGFLTYTSATYVTCGVFGSGRTLPRDDNGVPMQNFSPHPSFSATLSPGCRAAASFSTVGVKAVSFTCRNNATGAAVAVKVFLNAVETHYLSLSSGTFNIGQ